MKTTATSRIAAALISVGVTFSFVAAISTYAYPPTESAKDTTFGNEAFVVASASKFTPSVNSASAR